MCAYFYSILGVTGIILLVTCSVGCSAPGQEDGYILDAVDHYEPVSGQVQTSNITDNECHGFYYLCPSDAAGCRSSWPLLVFLV